MARDGDQFDVIICGAGVMGVATAYNLARRGAKVLGMDKFFIPCTNGSSHGLSRIIRKAYFEHPSYVPILQESYQMWRELEREAGAELLTITGSLEISDPNGTLDLVRRSREAADLHGMSYEILSGDEVNHRFPAYRLPLHYTAFYQPDSGILAAEECVAALASEARAAGAQLLENETMTGWRVAASGVVEVATASGECCKAKKLVLCSGPWIAEHVPELKSFAVPERQVVGWFAHNNMAAFSPETFPVFILDDAKGTYYGFPEFQSDGMMKIARFGHLNEGCIPSSISRDISEEDRKQMQEPLERYFPSVDCEDGNYRVCMFTNTPDSDFIMDFHPSFSQVLICSPCSGHGFKMAPAIGSIMADLALSGSTKWDISRHRLSPQRRGLRAQSPRCTSKATPTRVHDRTASSPLPFHVL